MTQSEAAADSVREAEHARLRALVAADLETSGPLHADDFLLVTPGGVTYDKAQYLGAIADGSVSYEVFEPVSEIDVRLYEGAAAIRYRSRIVVAAEEERYSDSCWHTDLYEERDGRWQIVWSQATRIGRTA
jgi:Domain of unknown function (DUF4440)